MSDSEYFDQWNEDDGPTYDGPSLEDAYLDEFPEEDPCHEWEEIWDDGVGQICQVCAICGEERVIHYDYEPEENGR